MLFALALGYLSGSIPFGLILTRLTGKGDIRTIGSGNIGATNVLRTGARGLAALTLLLDVIKGAVPVLLARILWGEGNDMFAATGAMLGHLYPVWLGFRGGKGVATFFGILLPILPFAAMIYAAAWLGVLALARYSSLAGIIAALSAPISAVALGREDLFPMLLGLSLLVLWKHRDNIRRLSAGTEPRVGKTAT